MAKTPAAPVPADAPADSSAGGKGRATPTRAEQEAARKRPLVADTKEAKARAKADMASQREKARIGMAAGEDRYLPARDKGPQRRFVRDFIDSGWHLGEAVMPAMVLVILATFVPVPAIQYYSFIGLWIFILFVIGDMIIASIRIKQAARKKFGDRMEKGLGWYGAMRIIQMRFMRLPKPQVKRGQHPV
ncbi:Protein of unknown function [Microbacterium sp. cf046]|uniref:DUF3043 domain-containing protein n=1 Tax=Microbacterium sp. cf046 TaxID=1761803 RepID=UPI0008F2BE22|nr:DUF3043 domain-containing protein [Microbacterium sp. cf046]SFS03321.1 Protein of unknown function [Microbacterium sp. cf046]